MPLLALYQLVLVNYGTFAGPDDAEAFDAAALGRQGRVLPRPVRAGGRIGGQRLSGVSNKCLAFDKNGRAFVKLMATIQIANAGRLWEVGGAAQLMRQRLREIMKRILTLSIAIMAVSALSAGAADAKATYEKDCAKCHGKDGKGQTDDGQETGRQGLHRCQGAGRIEGRSGHQGHQGRLQERTASRS